MVNEENASVVDYVSHPVGEVYINLIIKRETKVANPSNCMTACITCPFALSKQSHFLKNDTPRNKAQRIANTSKQQK